MTALWIVFPHTKRKWQPLFLTYLEVSFYKSRILWLLARRSNALNTYLNTYLVPHAVCANAKYAQCGFLVIFAKTFTPADGAYCTDKIGGTSERTRGKPSLHKIFQGTNSIWHAELRSVPAQAAWKALRPFTGEADRYKTSSEALIFSSKLFFYKGCRRWNGGLCCTNALNTNQRRCVLTLQW